MSPLPRSLAAVLISLASGASAQTRVDATAAAASAAPGASAAASVTSNPGAALSPLIQPGVGVSGSLAAPGVQSANVSAAASPAAAAASAAPVAGAARVVGAAPVASRAAAVVPASRTPAATPPAAANARTSAHSRSAADMTAPSAPASRDGARAPETAGSSLGGAAKRVTEAAKADLGDGISVGRALDRVFDAEASKPAIRSGGAAVAGRAQTVRETVARKVGIANTSSPADAPGLYQDAIQTAKDALPASVAEGVAKVVRGFASRKADVSLQDLATEAFQAAASGSVAETSRRLAAFDKWEALLGAPGRPLVTNSEALKTSARGVLDKAKAGQAPSAPHVWFQKKDGSFTAVLPGGGVAPVPALAASFAIAPSALAPETALGDAYRAFAADPRAGSGASLLYRARRELGASVPAAALSATRFWLRSLLEAVWSRVTALFGRGASYSVASKSGQDALRRDAALSRTARDEAAAAGRLLASPRPTVSAARAAFASAGLAASAFDRLAGEDVAAGVESLRRSFESAAASRGLRADDALPPALSGYLDGPGGLAHWTSLISDHAWRRVADARLLSAPAGLVNLGAERGAGVASAALAKELGAGAGFVALDDSLWASGRGANGEARLSAELRATSAGGSVELSVERADAALARRLEDLGLTVFPSGKGLRAVAGPEDFARSSDELGFLAARALAAALGAAETASAPAALRDLAETARREPADAAKLASLLDGREAFARAPVIGLVGEYEALGPTAVSLGGKPLLISALRDPDTGLLAYARAARADGAPLPAADLRALLRAK